jgi:hypothetical protein
MYPLRISSNSRSQISKLSKALFQLLMKLWTYQDSTGHISSSVLIHFIGVLGVYTGSLVYKSAYNSTSTLSALIWLGRLFFLEYTLLLYPYTILPCPWPSCKTYLNQADRLEEICTKYLFRGGLGPFAEILELKAFAKSIVKREGAPLNLS